jgi:hypothetical protein
VAVFRATVVTSDGDEILALCLYGATRDLDRVESFGTWEPEQLDEALAKLDRHHLAITGDDQSRG